MHFKFSRILKPYPKPRPMGPGNELHGVYAPCDIPDATPESPQIVMVCPECIGMLLRWAGLDQMAPRGDDGQPILPSHSPALYDGKNFVRPRPTDPVRLCGQVA